MIKRERERDGVVSVRGLWRESEEAQVTKSLQDLLRDQGLQNPSLIIYFKEFRYFCFWAFVGYLIMIELNSQKKKKKNQIFLLGFVNVAAFVHRLRTNIWAAKRSKSHSMYY